MSWPREKRDMLIRLFRRHLAGLHRIQTSYRSDGEPVFEVIPKFAPNP